MFKILIEFRILHEENVNVYGRKFSGSAFSEKIDLPSQPKIVIAGAGISGLAAADFLIKHGFTHISLLEASDRLGGRIWSNRLDDCICELGARWINFSDSSDSLYQLAKENGLLERKIEEDEKCFLTSKGEVINKDLALGAKLAFSGLISGASNKSNIKDEKSSKYYLQGEAKVIAQRIFKDQAHIALKVFDSLHKDLASFIGCDLSTVSVAHLNKIAKSYSNPIYVSEGLSAICRKLTRNLLTHQLHYGKPIYRIRWSNLQDNESPFVLSADGSKFLADHIICTIPLGALKNFASIMFEPRLPPAKYEAINKLGVGTPGKFFLKYPKDISTWFTRSLKPVWASEELEHNSDWVYDITEISSVPGSKTVLEVKLGGPSNEEAERSDDVTVVTKFTSLLRKFLNNSEIPYPQNILRSFWSTDAKFLGGQSFISIYSQEAQIKDLATPLFHHQGSNLPVLLFAGEATSYNDFGTLEGARRSGIREAQRIINFHLNKFDQGIE